MHVCFFISSPFLFVFGDDLVTCHTGADDVLGEAGDASERNEG